MDNVEIGFVFSQINENLLSVIFLDSSEFLEIPCVTRQGGYKKGDKVLIESTDSNKKLITHVLSSGIESKLIDYNNLPKMPMRIYRDKNNSESLKSIDDIHLIASKIIYCEGTSNEWSEEFNRDKNGTLISITTKWPLNGRIQFTTYINEFEDGYILNNKK